MRIVRRLCRLSRSKGKTIISKFVVFELRFDISYHTKRLHGLNLYIRTGFELLYG